MKRTIPFFLYLLSLAGFTEAWGQHLHSGRYNYSSFRGNYANNATLTTQPEAAITSAGAPCSDCDELTEKRTEKTRTFVSRRDKKHFWIQSSVEPMHFKDGSGHWLTIQPELAPVTGQPGTYASVSSPWPVVIDTRAGYISIGRTGDRVFLNRRLELLLTDADGTELSLGQANWSRYTAGDDGVYVTELWPGIDMEITVFRGATKTNFLIKKPMPEYVGRNLVIRDYLKTDEGLLLFQPTDSDSIIDGPLEIRHISGQQEYYIGSALAYESREGSNAATLRYRLPATPDRPLDICIPAHWLNLPPDAYPVTIDPLVRSSNSVTGTGGATYSASCNTADGCPYINPVPLPGGITISDVFFSFQYFYPSSSHSLTTGFDIIIDSCRSPDNTTYKWSCNTPPFMTSGLCMGTDISIFDDIRGCIPPAACAASQLEFTLRFVQCVTPTAQPCDLTQVFATQPFVVTVEGYTAGGNDTIVSPDNDLLICPGDSVRLTSRPRSGVAPFSFLWAPGGATDSAVTVKPAVSTTYTVTKTDHCGTVTTDTVHVAVHPSTNPGFTFSPDSVCPLTPITVKGNDTFALPRYRWQAPGSTDPAVQNVREWTTTYPAAGVYDITLYFQDSACWFPSTQQVTILGPAPEIHYDGHTLSTTEAFSSYQWQHNGADIPGATNREHVPGQHGDYTVIVTDTAGCTGTAAPHTLFPAGVAPADIAADIHVFPNPVTNMLYIRSSVPVQLTLCTPDGRTILHQTGPAPIHTGDLPPGIYLLRISDGNGVLLRTERLNRVMQ